MKRRVVAGAALVAAILWPRQAVGQAARLTSLTDGEARALSSALQGRLSAVGGAFASRVLQRCLADPHRGSALARAIRSGRLTPRYLWQIDVAVLRYVESADKSEVTRGLREGIATPVLDALSEAAANGRCDSFVAIGALAEDLSGEYGEAVEELVFRLLKEHPKQVNKCWMGARKSIRRLDLQTTAFCSDFDLLEQLYPVVTPGSPGEYVRQIADACPRKDRDR